MSSAVAPRIPTTLACIALIGRGVAIEIIRRKELYVLMILTSIYVVGVVIAGLVGIESAPVAVFLLNLGINFAVISAHLLTLLTAARQIPFELENRTIHPMLAKPLRRGNYLLGKWVAITGSGMAAFLVLFALSWIPWVIFPERPPLDMTLMMQAIVCMLFSLGLMAALGLLASLLLPQGVTITILLLLYLFGTNVANFIRARGVGTPLQSPLEWLTAYVPDFDKFNLFNRLTDGITALHPLEFGGLLLLAIIFTGAALVAMSALFERRPL